ncbi:MAG TPA: hypothetical protein VG328_14065 [Stellaceae bacterium]|jgi:hypothetical protein|nr:hypothetical protein [Stellaceae bacterium]
MKRAAAFLSLAGISLIGLAACAGNVPAPSYTQGRAIDQDITATHVVGPTVTSPAFTERNPTPTLIPWRNEEKIDATNRAEQTGQIPQ